MHKLHELDEAIVVVSCWSCFLCDSIIQSVCVYVCVCVRVRVHLHVYLLTTYEQTWEMCKFFMNGYAKGEGSDSISRCPELTFTLIVTCMQYHRRGSQYRWFSHHVGIGAHVHTRTHTHTYMCIHTQTPHTRTKYPVAKMAYSLFFSVHNIWTNLGDVQIHCGWVCKRWREWQHQSLLNSHLHWSLHLIHLIWFELFNISSC